MEISPLAIFYGSMLGLAVAALFVVMFRQGRSPTHNDMHNLARQTREELRADIKEAVRTATIEINAEVNRRIDETNRRIDDVNHRIDDVSHRIDDVNRQIAGLRQDINRVLAALANHEHIDGRVVVIIQPDIEPAPTAADD